MAGEKIREGRDEQIVCLRQEVVEAWHGRGLLCWEEEMHEDQPKTEESRGGNLQEEEASLMLECSTERNEDIPALYMCC